jgi:hypothetical protein
MTKRSLKKPRRIPKRADALASLRKALAKRGKAELVDLVLEFASADSAAARRLELRFGVETPSKELVAATREAIDAATDFDERQINYNFDYDYAAYKMVERNFGRLIKDGHLPAAMELSLELMKDGSYQVEMSDEGMMTDDIEQCLQVVVKALKKCDLPAGDVVAWCDEMLRRDRIGCICDDELRALKKRFEHRSNPK